MQLTQLTLVMIVHGVALTFATLVWRRWRKVRVAEPRSGGEVWSAGAESDDPEPRAQKATAWVAVSTSGCAGCGGCGCGG
jgi:hypothetical protein